MLQSDAFCGDGRLLLLFSLFLCLAVTPMSPSQADQATASLQAKFLTGVISQSCPGDAVIGVSGLLQRRHWENPYQGQSPATSGHPVGALEATAGMEEPFSILVV
jgi:hypothetical protein